MEQLEGKIEKLLAKLPKIEEELGDPALVQDQKRYRSVTQEHAYLSEIAENWNAYQAAKKQLDDNRELLQEEKDEDFAEMLRDDISQLEATLEKLEKVIGDLLVPPDPTDHCNTIVELRAGTGGDEAALFVGNCVRMYKLFADKMGWRYELLSSTPSDVGGFKEYVMVISGKNVYRMFKHESGTHRVQRVPETETQGRVHTSAITVAVLMEPQESEEVNIDEKELRVDTYRSSGAGGQHVNTTDSAVRITHLPTGIVVHCQDERSQQKNRVKAMRFLRAKIAEETARKQEASLASERSSQVGTGDRSGRIRTYNFPQNRLTDHRINLTRHNLDAVMEGELEEVSQALIAAQYQQLIDQ